MKLLSWLLKTKMDLTPEQNLTVETQRHPDAEEVSGGYRIGEIQSITLLIHSARGGYRMARPPFETKSGEGVTP